MQVQDIKIHRTSSSTPANAIPKPEGNKTRGALNTHTLTLLMFHAPWCPISKEFLPALKGISSQYADDLQVVKVDVDKNPGAALKFGIRSTPTYILIQDNTELWRRAGRISKSEVEEKLRNLL